jgi:hypothetical protein
MLFERILSPSSASKRAHAAEDESLPREKTDREYRHAFAGLQEIDTTAILPS